MRIKLDNVHHLYHRQRLVQLRGSIQCFNAALRRPSYVKVICADDLSRKRPPPIVWPVVNDCFKVLVLLSGETNRFKLWIEDEEESYQHSHHVIDSVDVCLRYEPPPPPPMMINDLVVRLVYVVCKDSQDTTRLFDDGQFEAPEDETRSVDSARRRISLGALMSQCFFAQSLRQNQTFQLELDTHGYPVVHCFVLDRSERDLWQLGPDDLWRLVASELMNSHLTGRNCKYLAFAGFSRYRPNPNEPRWLPSGQVRGYVSLGGGGLALLSTHCLYTWPDKFEDIPVRLIDDRLVDHDRFMDDSDNRNTRSGCYATTLGASIHELAHTFSLGHSDHGIMDRQFNLINHFFLPLQPEPTAWWTESEATILRHHKWLTTKAQSIPTNQPPFQFNSSTNQIRSQFGIAVVEYRQPGTNQVIARQVFSPTLHHQLLYKVQNVFEQVKICDTECLLFVMDRNGNIHVQRIHQSSFQ